MIAAAWVCLFSPLAAAVLITLGGSRVPRRVAGYLATASVAVAFVAAVIDFFGVIGRSDSNQQQISTAWTWLEAGSFNVGLSVLVDPLSVLMMLIVTGVGALIVGYSIGYMDGEDEERRYFAYMALFVFSMLLLVQGGNLLMLLIGWGLVGLSSYLLIGFYHQRPQAVAAAKKAFIMNAVGDATMALAFFLLIQRTGSLSFQSSFDWAGGETGTWAVNLVALGLLGGAVAKSAQLPLQTWLPDAMEGPTPVSALIHAATMVTAGVYLLVRTAPIFEAAKHVQELAAGLGAATLLVAGLVALVQTDIKRVIAYSTMSQIGYMFLGAGLGAYANAMFLLMAHAFFKALLFLAAGIVIHALAGEQDMRRMGGLRRYLPNTYWAFLIGALALAGIPPLSGFFAKDSILASALAAGTYGQILFVVGVLGTFLTGPLRVPHGLPRLRRRAVAVRAGASAPAGPLGAVALDGRGRGRAERALGDRRLGADPGRVEPVHAVPRADGHVGGRAERVAGVAREHLRRHARRGRDRGRLGRVLGAHAALPGGTARATRPRAQVLLRRALRRGLLPADRAARGHAARLDRAAAHPRVAGRDRHRRAQGQLRAA